MKTYSRTDVIAALRSAGLDTGDTVFLTTGLGMLGVAEGVDTPDDLNALHFSAVMEVIGESGTLLVPTFSYTFGSSSASEYAIFDPLLTESKIGPFPEFFRKLPGVVRSLDPMLSVAGLGPHAKPLLSSLPPTTYGEGCLFARLAQTDAKCCSLGLGSNWTPFIHHVDWLTRAPFRFDKLFHGYIRSNDTLERTAWIYSVPLLSERAGPNGYGIGELATKEGIWRFAPLGRARVYVCSFGEYFRFTLERALKNPWITAVGPVFDVGELERERVPYKHYSATSCSSPEEALSAIAAINRPDVSCGALQAYTWLSEVVPVTTHRFRSGENHFDWVIPERWRARDAALRSSSGDVVWSLEDGDDRLCSYSLSVSKSVSKESLRKHLRIGSSSVRPYWNSSRDRDWGFTCTQSEWEQLAEDRYEVAIATDFACGEMLVAESSVQGQSPHSVVFISYLQGRPWSPHLLGAYSMMELLRTVSERTPELTLRFLWLTSPAGLAAWVSSHPNEAASVLGCIECGDVSNLGASLPLYCPADSSVPEPFPRLVSGLGREFGVEIAATPLLPFSLTAGGNPCATRSLSALAWPCLSLGAIDSGYQPTALISPPGRLLASELHDTGGAARRVATAWDTLLG